MNTGTESQSGGERSGLRLGTRWRHSRRKPLLPEALASKIKSDCARVRASAQITRAAPAQPRHPSKANVIITETSGDTFSGKSARTVISKNSQGSDRKRSVAAITQRCNHP